MCLRLIIHWHVLPRNAYLEIGYSDLYVMMICRCIDVVADAVAFDANSRCERIPNHVWHLNRLRYLTAICFAHTPTTIEHWAMATDSTIPQTAFTIHRNHGAQEAHCPTTAHHTPPS